MYQIWCMPPQDQVHSAYPCWQFEFGNSPWWKIEHHRAMPTLDIHCLDVNGLHLFPDDRDADLLSRLSRLLVMETIFLRGIPPEGFEIALPAAGSWCSSLVPPLQQSAWTTHRQRSSRQSSCNGALAHNACLLPGNDSSSFRSVGWHLGSLGCRDFQ